MQGVLADLDPVLEFCRSLDLADEVRGTRFLQHRSRLVALRTAERDQGPRAARDAYNADPEANVVALSEAAELGRIGPFLRAADPKVLKPKLRDALRGPVLPSEEDMNSNHARNILFELNAASKLWEVGLAPVLGDRPDLRCDIRGTRMLLECKRPLTEGGARTQIARAWDSLTDEATKAGPGVRGVAVLSIGKLIPADQRLVVAATRPALVETLRALIRATAAPLKALAEQRSVPRVIGIHFHAILPAYVGDTGMLGLAEQTLVYPLTSEHSCDRRTLRFLAERLLGANRT